VSPTPLKSKKPHPERYVWPENSKVRWTQVEEILEFKILKHSGMLVRVKYDGGRESTWLHSKDFRVHTLWQGGTAAIIQIYG
jgi:hypothetical protein